MKAFFLCFFGACVVLYSREASARRVRGDLYTAEDGVTLLDEDNFADIVENSDKFWVVQFYASWCPHSKRFVKEYIKAAKEIKDKGLAEVGVIDGSKYKKIKRKYKVSGYPTVKFFGKDKSNPREYTGARKSAKIIDALIHEKKNNFD